MIALLEERDTLREDVRQLEEALTSMIVLPKAWRLTTTEERVICAIRAVGLNVLHRERGLLALYGLWDEVPDQKNINVWICKIRQKLREAQAEITIETVWGRGWRMTAESWVRFDAFIAADRPRWGTPSRAVA
ncbi:helix-turn-helix domain-containing protein [Methylobacterium sp. J-030]|uniref:helix-turn-helix domain-containing protein n=1 Tax=Methylobacterium sp. J-030 TaxID=2836627 RepID=UPI001FB94FD6|nr:helix-turn-helix domain-containing protein [Methylobacterium sp. J-030]MCJ2069582.1 helix-turn-helix domain-containing protein [Methylobacterium sp. J-030]